MGHLHEGDRAGWAALPTPPMECRVYLWVPVSLGKLLRPGLGKLAEQLQRNLPSPPVRALGTRGGIERCFRRRGGSEPAGGMGTAEGSARINTLSFPLSGSEPGKGVGTLGCGDLKMKAAKRKQRISPSLPPPHPSKQPPNDTRSRGASTVRFVASVSLTRRFNHLTSFCSRL